MLLNTHREGSFCIRKKSIHTFKISPTSFFLYYDIFF